MKFSNIILIWCLFSFSTPVNAQQFKAGQIEIRQISPFTIEAILEIYTEIHDDMTSIFVCWGDGNCSNLPLHEIYEVPDINANYHRFRGLYTYDLQGQYTISTSNCCWDTNIANIPSVVDPLFRLEASFQLINSSDSYNHSPSYQNPPFVVNPYDQFFSYNSSVQNNSADSLHIILDSISIAGYFFPEEFWPNLNSQILIDEDDGSFVWLSPPPLVNQYILKTVTTAYKGETMISLSDRYILLQTDLNTAINNIQESPFSIYPNPAQDILFLTENIDSKNKMWDYQIYDGNGRHLDSGKLEEPFLNIRTLQNGTYLLYLSNEDKTYIQPFLVIK